MFVGARVLRGRPQGKSKSNEESRFRAMGNIFQKLSALVAWNKFEMSDKIQKLIDKVLPGLLLLSALSHCALPLPSRCP